MHVCFSTQRSPSVAPPMVPTTIPSPPPRPPARIAGLVAGGGEGAPPVTPRQAHQLFTATKHRRGYRLRVSESLRGEPILTIAAVEIASEHAERQSIRPRQGVEERFLLDGIALQRPHVAPGDPERPPFIEAHLTDSQPSLGNEASVAA